MDGMWCCSDCKQQFDQCITSATVERGMSTISRAVGMPPGLPRKKQVSFAVTENEQLVLCMLDLMNE